LEKDKIEAAKREKRRIEAEKARAAAKKKRAEEQAKKEKEASTKKEKETTKEVAGEGCNAVEIEDIDVEEELCTSSIR